VYKKTKYFLFWFSTINHIFSKNKTPMADAEKNNLPELIPTYLCCLGCCLGMIVGVAMLVLHWISVVQSMMKVCKTISEQTCKDNCYEKIWRREHCTGYNGIVFVW
jgi:hypothetical protein